jgi:hypothetical protein
MAISVLPAGPGLSLAARHRRTLNTDGMQQYARAGARPKIVMLCRHGQAQRLRSGPQDNV